MPNAYKDGLSEWHLEHARNLMAQILEWRQRLPDTYLYYRLMDHLDTTFTIRETDIKGDIDLTSIFSWREGSKGLPNCKVRNPNRLVSQSSRISLASPASLKTPGMIQRQL